MYAKFGEKFLNRRKMWTCSNFFPADRIDKIVSKINLDIKKHHNLKKHNGLEKKYDILFFSNERNLKINTRNFLMPFLGLRRVEPNVRRVEPYVRRVQVTWDEFVYLNCQFYMELVESVGKNANRD